MPPVGSATRLHPVPAAIGETSENALHAARAARRIAEEQDATAPRSAGRRGSTAEAAPSPLSWLLVSAAQYAGAAGEGCSSPLLEDIGERLGGLEVKAVRRIEDEGVLPD